MKTFKIMLTASVMVLFLSLPAASFAMGGRHGVDGKTNNGQGNGHDKTSSDNGKHHNNEDDDIVGDGFFGEIEDHDPFSGVFNDNKNDEKNGDGEDDSKNTFNFKDEEDVDEWEDAGAPNNFSTLNVLEDTNAIPEPATMGLMLLGGAGLGLVRRKKFKA